MQDKEQFNNDQLVGGGWKQMRQLLDREMPAAGKRRRWGFFIWIVFAAGILLGFLLSDMLRRDQDAAQEMAPVLAGAQQETNPAAPAEWLPKDGGAEARKQTPVHGLSGKTGPLQANQATPVRRTSDTPELIGKPANAGRLPGIRPATLPLPRVSKNAKRPSAHLPLFPVLQRTAPELNATARTLSPPLLSGLASKRSSLRWFAETATLLHTDYAGGSFELGLAVQKSIGARLALRSGITYRQIRRPARFERRYMQDVERLRIIEGPSPDQQRDTIITTETVWRQEAVSSGDPLHLHYLAVPVRLMYDLSPRLALFSGLEMAYLLNREPFSTTEILYYTETLASDPLRQGYYSPEEQPGFRPWSFAWEAGFQYRLLPAVGLQLSYQGGLTDLTTNPPGIASQADRLRNWRAGLSISL